MSITNTKAKSVYNANGTTTEWNLGFTYDDTVSNVHIYIVDANDNETKVTSNYSIADGVLTYPTTDSGLEPLAEGNKLVIVRDTPRTQDIELTSNGKLDGKVLEGGYDKLTLQVQELTEQVNRAIKFPVTEDSADNFLDPITAITEAKKEALVEIAQATTPAEVAKETAVAKAQVATEQATIATNAATSAKAAQVGAEQAEQNATAQAEKAENAVTAFVEGLGTAKNAVIDLGTFDGQTSITSSRTIEFDKKPIAVSLRFSDTNKKLWINGTNSTVGIEVVDNAHCNLFYSIASADFVGQNAVKGPFVVQAIIQYSILANSATETEMGAVQLATKAEAEAGTNDAKAMTPLKTKYAIEANATVQTLRNDIDDLGDQVSVIEGKIPQAASENNQLADKQFVQDLTSALNFVQWVDTLPETGESKYIYAVPREETDTDGKQIAALYLWDGSAWRGAGAFSLNIDPDTLATKAELAGYLPVASKAVANGVASLDANARVPVAQIPDLSSTYATINSLATVATSGSYNDLTNKPTIPTVNNGTLTIQKNGTNVATFTANQSTASTANIEVPTKLSELTDDLGSSPVHTHSQYSTVANTVSNVVAGSTADKINVTKNGSTSTITINNVANATNATKATQDGDGNTISTTYAKKSTLATVATSGMYSDLTGTPGVATADTLGLVKPDGTTITVTENGTISATGGSGSGSGFDFEGTKAEFDAAVAAGTITEDSVSLITDDVSGDNVATKAELQAVDSSKADISLSNLSAAGKALASGLGMPSSRYIDLTLGASGSTYTAPANGYFVVRVPFTSNQACVLFNTTTLLGINLNSNGAWIAYGNIPVKKNDVVQLSYNCTPSLFRFVYAEGAE